MPRGLYDFEGTGRWKVGRVAVGHSHGKNRARWFAVSLVIAATVLFHLAAYLFIGDPTRPSDFTRVDLDRLRARHDRGVAARHDPRGRPRAPIW